MDSKLTLKLNESVIEQAKQFAKENNISLSRMIENYLMALTESKRKKGKVSSLIKSLTGVVDLKNEDYRKNYTDFLSKKHM